MRSSLGSAAQLALVVSLLAPGAGAVDGVLEINQACASGPGCFAGDGLGFPVQITVPGSYRLTSNLLQPHQHTTVISVTAHGVSVDLNGFVIMGPNNLTDCAAPGSGSGIAASSIVNDVSVSNGHVVGMGQHGVALFGANSTVDRISAKFNCGNGIQVGDGSLVTNSLTHLNAGNGVLANLSTRVSAVVAFANGASGIASTSNSGLLTVDSCITRQNAVDGIFVGNRSLVQGSVSFENADDGIAALGSGQVLENVTHGNTDRGITVLGSPGFGDSTAVGLNVTYANGSLNLSGGIAVGCNAVGAAPICPP